MHRRRRMRSQQEAQFEPKKNENDCGRDGENPPNVRARTGGLGRSFDCGGLSAIAVAGIDGSEETISPARHGFDEPGILRRITEGVPQSPNGGVQAVIEIDEGVRRPEPVAQLLAGHDFAGLLQKLCQYLERLLLELDLQPLAAQFTGAQIELVYAETASAVAR